MQHPTHPHDDHDLGLAADLQTLTRQAAQRRRALRWLVAGGAMGLGLGACGGGSSADSGSTTLGSDSSDTSGSSDTTGSTDTGGTCSVIPEETAGPYPGDGSNGANALALSGIVRSDITSSIAGATGSATGVPLTVNLQLVDTNGSCAALDGYAIYLWHCDAEGRYSMYSSGVTAENYLRGVQPTDSDGIASFTTIVPACYSGRWPHIHFEIYRSTSTAGSYTNKLKTSQLAIPQAVADAVYADTTLYPDSARNLAQVSLATDNIFSDGYSTQLAIVTGSVAAGYVASLQVGISV